MSNIGYNFKEFIQSDAVSIPAWILIIGSICTFFFAVLIFDTSIYNENGIEMHRMFDCFNNPRFLEHLKLCFYGFGVLCVFGAIIYFVDRHRNRIKY